MHNMVYLIGRLEEEITGETIKIVVERTTKNSEGEYIKDTIKCLFQREDFIKASKDNIKVGDLIAIKGSLEWYNSDLVVVVQKMSFLSRRLED